MPDLFMRRVENNADWTLFCPKDCSELSQCYGEEFRKLYEAYEADEAKCTIRRTTIKARALWTQILGAMVETGTPYIMFKDTCNARSNQKHLGVIKSSNLCCEIVQYSAPDETAVCNLASVALPRFADPGANELTFNFEDLQATVRILVRNLNAVIDGNVYPTVEARRSNMRHRPIAIGVQGLADVFAMLDMPYESEEAMALNEEIFANIYYAAVSESVDQAKRHGTYSTYQGSPASKGTLAPDFAGVVPHPSLDWAALRRDVASYGMRNSLLTAIMPTASTAQILGNSESVDPVTTNLYTRRTLAGTFVVPNKVLKRRLGDKYDPAFERFLVEHRGSVQDHPELDGHTKRVFKTAWEIKQKAVINHAARRAPYIDQAQSRSLYFAEVTDAKLSAAVFYAWMKKLKTGVYYTRTQPKANAAQLSLACTGCSA